LRPLAAQRQQHERCHEHHFKPDIEVENISGEKGAAHPEQQKLQ
jgi:hypothetical protein